MSFRVGLTIEYDDGGEQEIVADQRDMVIYEAEAKAGILAGLQSASITVARHLAYVTLKRAAALPDMTATRQQWSDTVPTVTFKIVEVDPTRRAASAELPSTSPSQPVRRSPKSSPGAAKTS